MDEMAKKFRLNLTLLACLLACGCNTCLASDYVQSYFDPPEPAGSSSSAGSLNGSVNANYNRPLTTGIIRSGALQGGIKSESSINPSLRVIPQFGGRAAGQGAYLRPGLPRSDEFAPVQYKGGVRAGGPLSGAEEDNGPAIYYGDTARGNTGRFLHGVIPPISTYVRTPANGVINYGPASSYLPSVVGTDHLEDPAPAHYKTVGRGITVLAPELSVSELPMPKSPGQPECAAVTMIRPGMGGFTSAMNTCGIVRTAMANNTPSAVAEPHYITRGGVTALPGYEVTITPPGLAKETLGGLWSAHDAGPAPSSLMATARPITAQPMYTRAEPVSNMATAALLPQFAAGRKCTDWGDWYRTVARAIYSRWQTADVCPGTAKLEVTVKADHDITARVIDFVPAADIERNVPKETEFRETSVRIVDNIGFFEIPDFPGQQDQVVFDIDLKRTVDGPTGVSVVGFPKR